MGKEEKEQGPMDSCPVPVPKVDEGKLLNDCRSPRFFKACQKLQIDPLDLRPKDFDSFAENGLTFEKQQIRMAMYERSRLSKWQTINATRFSLPTGDKVQARSKSAELLRSSTEDFANTKISWLPAERARTMQQASNGKLEVLKSTAKRLRDITAIGDFSEQEREELKQKKIEEKLAAERKRKEMIRKEQEKQRIRKERLKKERKEQEEREAALRELDENMQARFKSMHEAWAAESAEKQRKQKEHMEQIARNMNEADRKREEEVQKLLQGFERKEQQVEKMRKAVYGDGDSSLQAQAARAQQKRDDIRRANEAFGKQLVLNQQQKEAEQKLKDAAREEKRKELAKDRKEREEEARRRMADIQKKKKENLKEREKTVLEHLEQVDQNLKANREKRAKELELKAELEKLKAGQAQENVRREKARQRQEARELQEIHDDISAMKEVRDKALEKLKRERQLQATKIRLHKDELKEEVFSIQVQNSWNKAHKMLSTWEKDGIIPALEKIHE